MKKNVLIVAFMVAAFFFICCNNIVAQNAVATIQSGHNHSLSGIQAGTYNFTSFSGSSKAVDKLLSNAVEVISKRTRDSKYFIDKDTASKFYIIKASEDINYQKNGQWISINSHLTHTSKNIFEASQQQEPVGFDIEKKESYIKTVAGTFYFNNWELSGQDKDGERLLATADWSDFSAGDDGIIIHNVFPGIDAEMIVNKGSVETNFIIRQNKYIGYQELIFTDEFNSTVLASTLLTTTGEEADFSINKKTIAHIGKAAMYAEKDAADTYQYLFYTANQNHLSILINATNLNQQLLKGNVIVDPLVSSTSILPVASITGSMNFGNIGNECNYPLVVTTPAKATFTNIAIQFKSESKAPALIRQTYWSIIFNNCDTVVVGADTTQPVADSVGYLYTGTNDILSFESLPNDFLHCLPSPACVSQNVAFTFGFFNSVTLPPSNVCSNTYVEANQPFEVMIEGRTIEMLAIAANPATVCLGSPSTLTASAVYGVSNYTTNWSNGNIGSPTIVAPLVTTTYGVAIVDQCFDTAKSSVTVNVVDPVTPIVAITTPATTVCQGAATVFTATSTGGGDAPSYQWYLNGNPVSNNNPYVSNSLATGDKINCVLTSNYFCLTTSTANSDTLTMTVVQNIVPTASITSSNNNFCFGKTVTFAAHTTNVGPAPVYQWKVNGINVGTNDSLFTSSSLNNNDIVSCVVSVSNTGCYTVASVTSNAITMVVYPIPVITFSPDNIILARYDTTQLNVNVIGNIQSFTWTPTTGLINPESLTPTADPVVNTTYQLSVISVNDCRDTGDISIQVYDKIFIPNAFVPDGKNNIFRIPKSITFNLDNFSIYDRWGHKVFMTSDITQGWDGTVQGNDAPQDVYVYFITGSDARGKVFVKGTVTLIR